MRSRRAFVGTASAALLTACGEQAPRNGEAVSLLNVSYDPTRELYAAINPAFSRFWNRQHGPVNITMSHGGSGAQTQSVLDGRQAAQVVTLAVPYDVDRIAAAGLTDPNWRARLPNNSAPYTSIIVFVVRRSNPKRISDWPDLIRDDVSIVVPDPKTSGIARWAYLAAWAQARRAPSGDANARTYVQRLYANAPVLDAAARASKERFESGEGDVLIAWENEARVLLDTERYQIVTPSLSIRAEPSVAVIDANTRDATVRETANAYLEFLYTLEAQEIIAQHYYRPFDTNVLQRNASKFPNVPLVTVEGVFESWQDVQEIHFREGGVFDQIRPPVPTPATP